MNVPFVDLARQHAALADAFQATLQKVLQDSDFILGHSLDAFEKEFAAYLGIPYAIGVASGTDALHLTLRALDVGPGDEVIVPSLTFAATALAVAYTGARPVFVDVQESTFEINVQAIEAAITPRTRAILPVHLYGQPCDLDALRAIAERHHLALVEDACQAHGATYKGRRVGTFGIAGCFSFFPSKNLGALGDGGMIVTSDPALREKLLQLRNYGQRVKYHHEGIGYNSRLDSLQAAWLRIKLPKLDAWNAARVRLADQYRQALADLPLQLPAAAPADRVHVYHLFVVRSERRDALHDALAHQGVATGIHYPFPLHQVSSFANGSKPAPSLPTTERLCRDILSLPMFPEMRPDELDHVTSCVRHFYHS